VTSPEQRATLAELDALLRECAFVEPYRFRAISAAPGECELELPYREALDRPGGIVNGPALMAAADVAIWPAILTLRGIGEQGSLRTSKLRFSARQCARTWCAARAC
jgi:acyl-coenzyme A thioesterase PaaI-like protein